MAAHGGVTARGVGSARPWLCPVCRATSTRAWSRAEQAPHDVGAEPSHLQFPAVPLCLLEVGAQGGDRSGQAPLGAQQGHHGPFLVPVLGFLLSSVCISLIHCCLVTWDLSQLLCWGFTFSLASVNAQKSEH